MARVFINDFEIPKTCSSCSLFDWDDGTYSDTEGYCCAAKGKLDYRNTDALHEKHKECPLKEDGERNLEEVIANGVKQVIAMECLKENGVFKDDGKVGDVARFGDGMIKNLKLAVEALKGGEHE